MSKYLLFGLFLLVNTMGLSGRVLGQQTHPFLICTEDGKDPNFATLQARAADPDSPWGKMKRKSQAAVDGLLVDEVRIYSAALTAEEIADMVADPNSAETDDLELYWAMDGGDDVHDGSGHDRNGEINGISKWESGRVNNALRFWGSNDFVESGWTGITGNNPRTVAAWIKTSATDARQLFFWGQRAPTHRWSITLEKLAPDRAVLRLRVGGGTVTGDVNLADGQWHHFGVTFDGLTTDDVVFYFDGEVDTQAIVTSGTVNTAGGDPNEYPICNVSLGSFDLREYDFANDADPFTPIQKSLASAALCYILDAPRRGDCVDRIASEIELMDALREGGKVGGRTDGLYVYHRHLLASVPLFNCVLALDVVHPYLQAHEPNTLGELEYILNRAISGIMDSSMNGYCTIHGLWALYNGEDVSRHKENYDKMLFLLEGYNGQISASGVCTEGVHYAWYRLGANNDSKSYFMDVLEFTGNGSYYEDSRLGAFFEWLYGYSVTPDRHFQTFGDTDAAMDLSFYHWDAAPRLLGAQRFSETAAKYAAWCNNGSEPPGELLNYVLMGEELPAPEVAPSRIFQSGGAFFREAIASEWALAGALWNQKKVYAEGHSHHDTNAIQLCAYGEKVIQNAGYEVGDDGQDHSERSSTLLIGNSDHAKDDSQQPGFPNMGGIIEGFTTANLDYACGDAGWAISGVDYGDPNTYHKHLRNLLFVHPGDNGATSANGYWVLFDEVDAYGAAQANLVLHPYSAEEPSYSQEMQDYTWRVNKFHPEKDTWITIFLGTEPDSVGILKFGDTGYRGQILSRTALGIINGTYMKANYSTDAAGLKNIVTVLFPHDDTHALADIERVAGTYYTGAKVDHGGGVVDYALESHASTEVNHEDVWFSGKASHYRLMGNYVVSYFLRQGTMFVYDEDNDSFDLTGFEVVSGSPVSLYMRQENGIRSGKIITTGQSTQVLFYQVGVHQVIVKDSEGNVLTLNPAPTVDVQNGTASLTLPGIAEYQIALVSYGVHNTSQNTWFSVIDHAIVDVLPGDEIIVYPGTYRENLVITGYQPFVLRSLDPANWAVVRSTVIDGDKQDTTVYIGCSDPEIRGLTITGGFPFGSYLYGGGFHIESAGPTIANCIIHGNEATGEGGGGIYSWEFQGETYTRVINCLIYDNVATTGGGIYVASNCAQVVNCTIVNNTATNAQNPVGGVDLGIGGYCGYYGTMVNSIICGNSGAQVRANPGAVTYSDVAGGFAGTGNIDSDPNFVDPNSDFHITAGSPCIDTGDPGGNYTGLFDMDGDDRVIDVAGKGDGTVDVDMGADEYVPD